MKLVIVSHAYVQPGYLSALRSMTDRADVALVTPNRYRSGLHAVPCVFACTEEIRAYPVPIVWGQRQGTFIYNPPALADLLSKLNPDVILHDQEVYALGAAQVAWAAARRSIPLVMFVWENVHRRLAYPRRILSRWVLDRCAGILMGSQGAVAVHRDWGFQGPVAVIPQMGVEAVNPSPAFGGRDPRCLRIAFAGRVVPEKGIDCLLRAVAELLSSGIRVCCTIAGLGPSMAELLSLVSNLNIGHAVEFPGLLSRESVRSLLASSDVLVLASRKSPTWEEQFGRILVEAMAEATVTVGSRTGAIPEVIDSEDLLFDENDHFELAGILSKLATNQTLLIAHQKRLWQRAGRLYTDRALSIRRLGFLETVYESRQFSAVRG